MDDDDLHVLSLKHLSKLRTNWQAIIEKYDQPFSDDDEIHLSSLSIVTDKGRIRSKAFRQRTIGKSKFAVESRFDLRSFNEDSAIGSSHQSTSVEQNMSDENGSSQWPKSPERETFLIPKQEESEEEPSDAETLSSWSSWSSVDEQEDESSDNEVNNHSPRAVVKSIGEDCTRLDGQDEARSEVDKVVMPILVKSDVKVRRIVLTQCINISDPHFGASQDNVPVDTQCPALNMTYDVLEERQLCAELSKSTTFCCNQSQSADRSSSMLDSAKSMPSAIPVHGGSGGAIVISESVSSTYFAECRSARKLTTTVRQADICKQFNQLRSRCLGASAKLTSDAATNCNPSTETNIEHYINQLPIRSRGATATSSSEATFDCSPRCINNVEVSTLSSGQLNLLPICSSGPSAKLPTFDSKFDCSPRTDNNMKIISPYGQPNHLIPGVYASAKLSSDATFDCSPRTNNVEPNTSSVHLVQLPVLGCDASAKLSSAGATFDCSRRTNNIDSKACDGLSEPHRSNLRGHFLSTMTKSSSGETLGCGQKLNKVNNENLNAHFNRLRNHYFGTPAKLTSVATNFCSAIINNNVIMKNCNNQLQPLGSRCLGLSTKSSFDEPAKINLITNDNVDCVTCNNAAQSVSCSPRSQNCGVKDRPIISVGKDPHKHIPSSQTRSQPLVVAQSRTPSGDNIGLCDKGVVVGLSEDFVRCDRALRGIEHVGVRNRLPKVVPTERRKCRPTSSPIKKCVPALDISFLSSIGETSRDCDSVSSVSSFDTAFVAPVDLVDHARPVVSKSAAVTCSKSPVRTPLRCGSANDETMNINSEKREHSSVIHRSVALAVPVSDGTVSRTDIRFVPEGRPVVSKSAAVTYSKSPVRTPLRCGSANDEAMNINSEKREQSSVKHRSVALAVPVSDGTVSRTDIRFVPDTLRPSVVNSSTPDGKRFGGKTRIRQNLTLSDHQPVCENSTQDLPHSPRVKRMWHDLSGSPESESSLDQTLAEECIRVARNVRTRIRSPNSVIGVNCSGPGKCTKAFCFTCVN